MKPSPSKFGIAIFDSIDYVPEAIWNSVNQQNKIFFQPAYLRALESAPPQGMAFRYAILYDKRTPVAIVPYQIANLTTSQHSSNGKGQDYYSNKNHVNHIVRKVKEKIGIRMLISGNALVTGEYGISYLPNIDPKDIFHGLAEVTYKIQRLEKMNGNINCVLIKDFYQQDNTPSERLKDFGYHKFSIGPNTIVPIRKEWNSFDDYILSMTSSYRRRVRRALIKGTNLIRKDLTVDEISKYKESIYELYMQVHNRSNFRVFTHNPRIFEELKAHMGKDFSLEVFFLEDLMVAFTTRFFNGSIMEGYTHGISYEHNKKFALYQNILYDDIRIGINNRVKLINWGRTTIGMKSAVGAVPKEMSCFLRLNNSISNHFISPLFHLINHKEEQVRKPFKEDGE